MVLWAIYCACLRLRPDVHPLSFLFALSIVALIGNVPFALWEHASGYHLVADTKTALAILYAAVFTTLLAYVTWNRGIDLIGAPRAGAFLHTIPLVQHDARHAVPGRAAEAVPRGRLHR